MAIIKGLRSTTIWKAFILNSLAASISIVTALIVKSRLEEYTDSKGHRIKEHISAEKYAITFAATFIATLAAYTILHILFGYGGGQLVAE